MRLAPQTNLSQSGEERLLRNISRQASPAVHAGQLTKQLQRSRERLIAAREEERRRLSRDLHDGLGPQLATVTIKVDAARNLLNNDPATADELLAEIKTESQDAVREIRRVVEGLRPAALDQLGITVRITGIRGPEQQRQLANYCSLAGRTPYPARGRRSGSLSHCHRSDSQCHAPCAGA